MRPGRITQPTSVAAHRRPLPRSIGCVLVSLGAFTVAAVLIVLLPGPDTLVVLRNLVRGGRRTAARTAAGVLTGLAVWVLAAALGLSALLRASHDGYLALRIAGGCYLVWLGVQSWRSRGAPATTPASTTATAPTSTPTSTPASPIEAGPGWRTGYAAGLATDLLNPKVGVFFVTFLPGFIPAHRSVAGTSLLMGAIFVALTAAYFVALLAAAGRVVRWMGDRRVRRRMDRATGAVLLAFGVRLILEG